MFLTGLRMNKVFIAYLKSAFRVTLKLLFISIFFACDNEAPVINSPIYNFVCYDSDGIGGSKRSIYLSVHFMLYDGNGVEDIVSIDLVNRINDYRWHIEKKNIEETIYGDNTYYGYSFFEYNGAQSVLLGEYLIQVEDSVGNVTEYPLYVETDNANKGEFKFPDYKYEINIKDNKLTVTGVDYSSLEYCFTNDPSIFNNSRMKHLKGSDVALTKKNSGTIYNVSVRLNIDDEEKIVFFTRNIKY